MSGYPGLPTGSDFGNMLEPDALISARFYDTTQRTFYANAELRLMAAILEDAVAILTSDPRRYTKQQRHEFADAMDWITRMDENQWVFSFVNICESLGIDPACLRQGLLRKIADIGNRVAEKRSTGCISCRSPRQKLLRLRAPDNGH